MESAIRAASPQYAALTQPQPLDVGAVQKELGPDTLLLEYSLGEAKSYLWVVNSDSVRTFALPARSAIESAARRLYDLLNARQRRQVSETPSQYQARLAEADARLEEAAAELSRMILAPAGGLLKGARLLVVADGALHFIPFAALPTPDATGGVGALPGLALVSGHEIVSMPSASIITALRRETAGRQPAPKMLAVIADPVFSSDDERVRRAPLPTQRTRATDDGRELSHSPPPLTQLQINRLPGTRQEAERILALTPPTERLQAFDFQANLATATGVELGRYRYVHFATHGYLDTLRPELSAVVLSLVDERGEARRGFLRAHEVYGLKLPVEMVVLSACETGLGKEIRGEGLIGLTRGFMYAGAPRVVVSLWSVQDRATAELMEKFYRGLLVEKLSPAAALRAAQIEMLGNKEWQSPFYWAGFTLPASGAKSILAPRAEYRISLPARL